MTPCPHHAAVFAANLRAISGHRRRKTNQAIQRAIVAACPNCIAATKGHL